MNRSELDYYAILNIPRDSKPEQITLAYRNLAIRLCPFRDRKHERDFMPLANENELTHMNPLPKTRQWEYINMAYDILGNELHRAIYDRFGEAGLYRGTMLPNGYFPPYQYHGDHMKVYYDVFGSYSPYANLIDVVTNPPVLYSTTEHGIGVRTRDPPSEKIICLELEEVYRGTTKLMNVMRQEFIDAAQTQTEKRKKTLKVYIAPGTTPGTRYCFKEEGDRYPTRIPGDVIFITEDKPHSVFERRNHHDLVYKHEIDLCQALIGFRFTVETLDKRLLKVSITNVVYPGFTKVIPSEGLPKCIHETVAMPSQQVKPKYFGDLIIEFPIKFPKHMSSNMKRMTRDFFKQLAEMSEMAESEDNPILAYMQRMSGGYQN